MILDSYKQVGGKHPETAAITNILANQGFTAPHTGRPLSEEMILGIAGGLGAGYILWEFKKYDAAVLVMGFQNRWNYTMDFMQNLCDRLGVTAEFQETGGKKTASKNLASAIENGRAAVAWVDQQSLPYFHMQPMYGGCFGHFVSIFGLEDGQVYVDDRTQKSLVVDAGAFAEARARIGSYKNRLLLLDSATADFDLETAVRAGIEDCAGHLGRSSQTFAIPVYQKWARMVTDTKNKKGWPRVFKDGKGLYSTLKSIHEGIKLFGTGGAGLRGMYADFLAEASSVLNNPALNEAVEGYRQAAARWVAFADATLPDHVPVLRETRQLLARKYQIFLHEGESADLAQIGQQLQDMEAELNSHLPLSDADCQALFADLQEHLYDIYVAEKEALAALEAAVS